MRAAIVVPTNRPERMQDFVESWAEQFDVPDVRLIVCEDNSECTFPLPIWVEHYSWQDIDDRLADKAGCIPRHSGGVRNFGFWLAGTDKTIDMIVSLDDDVRPDGEDFLMRHWAALNSEHCATWYRTTPFHVRGEPYHLPQCPTMLNHGLWRGVPDIDAFTQLQEPGARWNGPSSPETQFVPRGMYFSVCGMNVAFQREATPYYYFPVLPNGLRRWDDIWCGHIFKRIADLCDWGVTSGQPCVKHERASNVLTNLRQEMFGYGINERIWQVINNVSPPSYDRDPSRIYAQIASAISTAFPELTKTVDAMQDWLDLWVNR